MTPARTLWALVLLSTVLRMVWAGAIGPGNDEAYHYLYAVHPAWSYYDHPPMMALIAWLGLHLCGGTASIFALRLGFVLLFAGSTLLMARLTRRHFGPWAGVMAAVVLNLSAYHTAAVGAFALPDGPLLFFWLLTLDQLSEALNRPESVRPWLWVGVSWGCALLSKYHAVFLPAGAFLYMLASPPARSWLRRPGPYLAVIIGMGVFSPVLVWNATHGWSSFAFQAERATGALHFRPDSLLGAIGGAAAYLFPWIWLFLIVTLYRRTRSWIAGTAGESDKMLICQSIFPLATFLAVACVRPVLPHWILVGYLSLMPMLGDDWAALRELRPARMRRRLRTLTLLTVIPAVIYATWYQTGLFQKGAGLIPVVDASDDPTAEMYGWNQVAEELQRRGLTTIPGTFLFTSKWYQSGHLAFALRNSVPVLCYNATAPHGFAQWSSPEQWVGHDGILLSFNDSSTEPDAYDRWFERIEPIGEFAVRRAGVPIRTVRIFRCVRQTQPFPFGGNPPDSPETRIATTDRVTPTGTVR
jgi:hypothetical protein